MKLGWQGGGEASDRTYLCHPRHLRELSLTPTMAASMGGAFHSGEDFERGRVHHVQQEERLHGVEPTDANEDTPDERAPRAAADRAPRPTNMVDLETVGNFTPSSTARSGWQAMSPRSTRHSGGAPSPREDRAAARETTREADDDARALMLKPWRGQADRLTKAHKNILEHFEERGIKRPVMEDGHMITKVVTIQLLGVAGEGECRGGVGC